MKKIYLAALTLMGISPLTATAQEKVDMFNPEKNSVTSQSIAPDARAGGMGDVGAATDPDVASQFWNPAKYPFTISRAGVSLNYTPWLRQLVSATNPTQPNSRQCGSSPQGRQGRYKRYSDDTQPV